MIDLETYKENARKHAICSEFLERWDACKNKKDIIDMVLHAQGVEYTSKAISEGWGVTSDYVVRHYSRFINGNYVHKNERGYTSSMYCRYKGSIIANTTLIFVIDSDIDISIPRNYIIEVFCVGNTNVKLRGEGRAVVVRYNDKINIECINNKERIKIKNG